MILSRCKIPVAALIATLSLLAGGCTMIESGDAIRPTVDLSRIETRAEVFATFGLPDNIYHHRAGQTLFYASTVGAGGGVGIGYSLITLAIARTHITTDTIVFHLDFEGRVIGTEALRCSDFVNSSIWPFGG